MTEEIQVDKFIWGDEDVTLVKRHYSPIHPGTGTDQQVHAGREGQVKVGLGTGKERPADDAQSQRVESFYDKRSERKKPGERIWYRGSKGRPWKMKLWGARKEKKLIEKLESKFPLIQARDLRELGLFSSSQGLVNMNGFLSIYIVPDGRITQPLKGVGHEQFNEQMGITDYREEQLLANGWVKVRLFPGRTLGVHFDTEAITWQQKEAMRDLYWGLKAVTGIEDDPWVLAEIFDSEGRQHINVQNAAFQRTAGWRIDKSLGEEPGWFVDIFGPLRRIKIERHYGPGRHPGTGTEQQVHAGGRGGGAAQRPQESGKGLEGGEIPGMGETAVSDQSGPPESFQIDEWRAMEHQERIERWNSLSVAERDRLADASRSISREQTERIASAGERPNSGNIAADIQARVKQFKDLLTEDSSLQIATTAEELNYLLERSGVDADTRYELVMESLDALTAQDNEAYARQIGDHGINHIRGNILASMEILQEVPGVDPAEQIAKVYLANIFHDTGYLTEPSQTFLDRGHPRWSTEHYDANIRGAIERALGPRAASDVAHIIRTHAFTDIDWDNDPIGSATRVADNLALFQKEKLPPIFRHVPGTLDALERMATGEIDLETAKNQMRDHIDTSTYSDRIKDQFRRAVDEVSPVTPKFTLGMLGGELEGFEWEDDHLAVYLRRSQEATRLNRLLDLGQRQFAKFAKVYGVDPEHFTESLEFEFQNESGQTVLESKIVGGATWRSTTS